MVIFLVINIQVNIVHNLFMIFYFKLKIINIHLHLIK